jgi:hypothetical protein
MDAPYKAVEFIIENSAKYAEAKSKRIYISEFRKSKKALLMKEAMLKNVDAANAQEREAYSNQEYIDLLDGLAAAIEEEERLSWMLEAAKLKIEIWKTESFNNRRQDRASE